VAVGPVLVVDDDTVSRHVLIQALANAELPHVAVGSGTEALAQIEKVQPSLVLLDLVMPPPDGYQILRILRAREETRDLPVVVLTALEADEEIAKAFEAGADDFVRKPFKPVELVARIRGQLRLRGAIDALEKKEQDARLVLELTQALASNLDFRGILFTVVQRIAEVARVDRVSIVLVREAGDVGYVVAASDDEQLRDLPIDLAKYPEIQQVLSSRSRWSCPTSPRTRCSRSCATRGTARPSARSPSCRSSTRAGRWACSSCAPSTPSRSARHELELCKTVSNAMAIALRNARVMQSLRDQTQQVTVARFEAERRLRTLQRYADFFESAADGIIVIDAEGHLLFSNPRARAITMLRRDGHARPQGGRSLRPGGRRARARPAARLRARGSTRRTWTSASGARTESWHVLNFNFNSVLREEGVVLCTFRDVTQERAVESELHKTKDFLQRIIDSSVDAIMSADMNGDSSCWRTRRRSASTASRCRSWSAATWHALPRGGGPRRDARSSGREPGASRGCAPRCSTRTGDACRSPCRPRCSTTATPRSARSASSPIFARRCGWSSASPRRRSRSCRRSARPSSPSSPAQRPTS
jgi:PAS domain S-box-containing protein